MWNDISSKNGSRSAMAKPGHVVAEVVIPWEAENLAAGKGDSFGNHHFLGGGFEYLLLSPLLWEDEPIVGLIRMFFFCDRGLGEGPRVPSHDSCLVKMLMIVMGHEVMKFINRSTVYLPTTSGWMF